MLRKNNAYIEKVRTSIKKDLYGSMVCGASALPW